MTGGSSQAVLRRMAGASTEEIDRSAVAETPARTLRLALARAAEETLGMRLMVASVSDELGSLDEVASRFEDDVLHMALLDGSGVAGYAVIDGELRSAVVEVQMTGQVSETCGPARPVTSADAALSGPLVTALMADLLKPDRPGHFGPWVADLRTGGLLAGPRAISLIMTDGTYRVLDFGIDLGAGGRRGQLSLVLPDRQSPAPAIAAPERQDWSAALSVAVRAAPAELTAVLHRLRLGLTDVAEFEPGTVLPLHGVTVDSITLEAPGRKLIGYGRLGQVAGLRAVRISDGRTPPKTAGIPIAIGTVDHGADHGGADNPALPGVDSGVPLDPVDNAMAHGHPEIEALDAVGDLPDIEPLAEPAELPEIGDPPDVGELPDGGHLPDISELPDIGAMAPADGVDVGELPDLPELPEMAELPPLD